MATASLGTVHSATSGRRRLQSAASEQAAGRSRLPRASITASLSKLLQDRQRRRQLPASLHLREPRARVWRPLSPVQTWPVRQPSISAAPESERRLEAEEPRRVCP